MPTSNLWLAPTMCELVAQTGARSVLDIGPGYGKFGVLLREYAGVEVVDAVELWRPYITAHHLDGIYRNVMHADVRLLSAEILARYDLVFMSEVIEHTIKPEGKAFLDRCPGWVVVSTPLTFFQHDHEVPTERHRSLWTAEDFPADRVDKVLTAPEHTGLMVRLRPKPDEENVNA